MPQGNAQHELGRRGEELAANYLADQGMTILERNYRCDLGELDIIACEGSRLVVCEVKTRTSLAFGGPFAAVSPRKVRRLRRLALRWLAERAIHAPEVRFDVVGILLPADGTVALQHVRGVE